MDPDGDGGDGGIDGYYDYYHTRTMGDGRVGDIFDRGDSRRRSGDSQTPVVTLNDGPLPHHRHTLTLQNDVVEFYGRKMDMNGGMGPCTVPSIAIHSLVS